EPQVLVLDEPSASLDSAQTQETLQLIRALGDRRTVMLSSRIPSEVNAVCDRVLLINGGRLVADEAPGSLSRRLAEKPRRKEIEAVIARNAVSVPPAFPALAGDTAVNITGNSAGTKWMVLP